MLLSMILYSGMPRGKKALIQTRYRSRRPCVLGVKIARGADAGQGACGANCDNHLDEVAQNVMFFNYNIDTCSSYSLSTMSF